MEYSILGKTGFNVSRLCFGALTIGPLQRNLEIKEGASVILEAFERGINFIDTAELYGTYGHIKEALSHFDRSKITIISKSYSYDTKTAEKSLEMALRQMNLDYIDGFLLHEQESEHTLRGHYEAFEYFNKMKDKGYIRSIGISTHNVGGVKAANKISEIDIIHPIVNISGLGIHDGTLEEMLAQIKIAYNNNIGIYAMKPLGGGNLIHSYDEAMDYILGIDCIHSIAMGMQSKEEVIANISKLENIAVPEEVKIKLSSKKRVLAIADWCTRCEACVKKCSHNALALVEDKITVEENKCVLCGYCSKYCKDFCIKII